MLTVNLFDANFPGQACSVANQIPSKVQYVRDQPVWDGISFFTDAQMFQPIPAGVTGPCFGWLHEGRELHPENYEQAWGVLDKFTAIFTTVPEMWKLHDKFWPCIRGGTWVPPAQWGIYEKTRNLAMITSSKQQTVGHRLRHQVVSLLKELKTEVDHFGVYGQDIGTDKARAYADSRFALVIEAQRSDGFFSEHLLDAIALGCVPVYWGCPNIGQFFDPHGLVCFETLTDLEQLLPRLTPGLFRSKIRGIATNLGRLPEYAITDDWIVTNLLEPFYGQSF